MAWGQHLAGHQLEDEQARPALPTLMGKYHSLSIGAGDHQAFSYTKHKSLGLQDTPKSPQEGWAQVGDETRKMSVKLSG